jgi:hypothetical protein
MKLRAKDVLNKLEIDIGISGRPVRLRDAITYTLQESFGFPEIQATENAELLEAQIRELILKEEGKIASPKLTIVASAEHLVSGYLFVNSSDSFDVAAAKRGRLNVNILLQEIRNLTFPEFERFGACVLKELGAKQVRVTSRSADQGIDFYGVLSLGQNSFLPSPFGQLAHDVRLLFAGQAKHYPIRPIGPELMRELVGSISLARHKVFTISEDLFEEGIELLPFNPLVAMFFTTGRFTNGALDLAKQSGVIAKSGEELAVFLADRNVGMYDDHGEVKFDKAKFHKWLSTE